MIWQVYILSIMTILDIYVKFQECSPYVDDIFWLLKLGSRVRFLWLDGVMQFFLINEGWCLGYLGILSDSLVGGLKVYRILYIYKYLL